MKVLISLVMITVGFFSAGPAFSSDDLNAVKGTEAEVSQGSKPEDNPLEKIMLERIRQPLDVSHDPFVPLIIPKEAEVQFTPVELEEQDPLMGMRYIGLVKLGDAYSVLLHTESGKGVYQVNDQIKDLTIAAIDESSITFKKGSQVLTLQRGDM